MKGSPTRHQTNWWHHDTLKERNIDDVIRTCLFAFPQIWASSLFGKCSPSLMFDITHYVVCECMYLLIIFSLADLSMLGLGKQVSSCYPWPFHAC